MWTRESGTLLSPVTAADWPPEDEVIAGCAPGDPSLLLTDCCNLCRRIRNAEGSIMTLLGGLAYFSLV
jgi:hypothetical protein